MTYHVYSTLSCDVRYTVYRARENLDNKTPEQEAFLDHRIPQIEKQITIKGGANVHRTTDLITPLGVKTEVSEADFAFLETVPLFKEHQANGFIKVLKRPQLTEDAVKGMKERDNSAPLIPRMYEAQKDKGVPQPYRME